VGKFAEHDEENNEAGDPTPELVRVDDLVSEQRYNECADRDDEYTSKTWHITIHSIQQLGTNDGINRRPANACKDVENSN
jgi:hypothetical protein